MRSSPAWDHGSSPVTSTYFRSIHRAARWRRRPRLRGGRSPARPPLALGLARLARRPARPFSALAGRSACPPPPAAAPRRRRRRAAHAARGMAAAAAAAAARPRLTKLPSAGRAGLAAIAAAAAAAAAAMAAAAADLPDSCNRCGWRSVICATPPPPRAAPARGRSARPSRRASGASPCARGDPPSGERERGEADGCSATIVEITLVRFTARRGFTASKFATCLLSSPPHRE